MFNMLGAIAQFEQELMIERQREGIAKAKAEGKSGVRRHRLAYRHHRRPPSFRVRQVRSFSDPSM
jgi:DNA invertase Pin-like site-specific DNA recombinase